MVDKQKTLRSIEEFYEDNIKYKINYKIIVSPVDRVQLNPLSQTKITGKTAGNPGNVSRLLEIMERL